MKLMAVAGLMLVCLAGQVSAQFVIGVRSGGAVVYGGGAIPLAYPRGPVLVGRGITTNYFAVANYYPPPYYVSPPLAPPQNITINNFYGGGPILGPGYDADTRGVDLDRFPVNKSKPAEVAEPKPKPVEKAPAKVIPGVDVAKSRPPMRPDDAKVEKPLKIPPLPQEPMDEFSRLIELGLSAFQASEDGLAAQRFRHAVQSSPKSARAWYLLSQAEFASGNYREAVTAIEAGMKLDKSWPRAPQQPRLDLYKDRMADYTEHMRRLSDAVAANPDHPTLLFLVAHQLWFDGQRKDAVTLFHRARPMSKTTNFIDVFLAAGAGI